MENAERHMRYLIGKGRSGDYPRGLLDALRWVIDDDDDHE
jgi:hypothetical protein